MNVFNIEKEKRTKRERSKINSLAPKQIVHIFRTHSHSIAPAPLLNIARTPIADRLPAQTQPNLPRHSNRRDTHNSNNTRSIQTIASEPHSCSLHHNTNARILSRVASNTRTRSRLPSNALTQTHTLVHIHSRTRFSTNEQRTHTNARSLPRHSSHEPFRAKFRTLTSPE